MADESSLASIVDLANDYLDRHRRGEHPTMHEYEVRFPEMAGEIREVFPMMLLMEEHAPSGEQSGDENESDEETPQLERLGDFRILCEVGRGGMGVVYEAVQESLGRHVAIKVLPAHSHLNPRHRERFKRESRAAAMLHHTNIVPVFAVGVEDGMPYYAMQYIRGAGLDEVIEELKRLKSPDDKTVAGTSAGRATQVARSLVSAPSAQPADSPAEPLVESLVNDLRDPAETEVHGEMLTDTSTSSPQAEKPDSISSAVHLPGQSEDASLSESRGNQFWRSFAEIGLQVADAISYAHGQGTLHRDIKPSNLLLDQNGVVWVTDFGLAKLEDEGDLTRSGEFVGTLRYTAPEQFNGHSDARSDVYSLGLTLYELATLRPAFDNNERNKLIHQVVNEQATRPRKVNPTMPRDLETIVLKAIAREPAQRYQTVEALRDDIRAFLADKPIRARRTGVVEHIWRWCRRNPSGAALIVSLLLLMAISFSGAMWYVQDQAQKKSDRANTEAIAALKAANLEREVEAELRQARALADKALGLTDRPHQWATMLVSALSAAQRAELLVRNHDGPRAKLADRVRRSYQAIQAEEADRQMVDKLERIRLEQSEIAIGKGRFKSLELIPKYREAFEQYGMSPDRIVPGEAAKLIRTRSAAIRRAMITALDDWGFYSRLGDGGADAWVHSVVTAADDDAWRQRVRQAMNMKEGRVAALKLLAAESEAVSQPPATVALLATYLTNSGARKESVDLMRRALARYPDDFWVHHQLGYCLLYTDPGEAARFFTAATALRPKSPGALLNAGLALARSGKTQDAIACYQRAIAILPEYANAHNNLAAALRDLGRNADALAAYDKAIEVNRNPDYGQAHANRGRLLSESGRHEEAIAACREAISRQPKNARFHADLGTVLQNSGQRSAAIASFQAAIASDAKNYVGHSGLSLALKDRGELQDARKELLRAIDLDPLNAELQYNLGILLKEMKDLPAAVAAYRTAIKLNHRHAVAHYNLGLALHAMNRKHEALAAYRQAIEIRPKYAQAYNNMGGIFHARGEYPKAISAFDRAIQIDPKLAIAHSNRSKALRDNGQLDEAEVAARTAIEIDPNYGDAHLSLSAVLVAKNELESGAEACRQAIKIDSKQVLPYVKLAVILRKQGKFADAVATLEQATKVDPDYAFAWSGLGNSRDRTGDFSGAEAAHRKAILLSPSEGLLYDNFGLSFLRMGKSKEAVEWFRQAILRRPYFAPAHYRLGLALKGSGEVNAAVAAYRSAIFLNPRYAEARVNLALILKSRGELAEAAKLLRQATQLKPGLIPAQHALGVVLQTLEDRNGAKAAFGAIIKLRRGTERTYFFLGELALRDGSFDEALKKFSAAGGLIAAGQRVQLCRRLLALEPDLDAILSGGKLPADDGQTIDFAELCFYKNHFARSADVFKQAVADLGKPFSESSARLAYLSVCAISLAGCQRQASLSDDDAKARSEFRKLALTWLRADVDLRAEQLNSPSATTRTAAWNQLNKWRHTPDLLCVRDNKSLAKLPKSERHEWQELWRRVDALLPASKPQG